MTRPDKSSVRHFERVEWSPSRRRPPALSEWPYSIPAVAQIIAEQGLEIPPGITILVGENGSGKSTIVEALAAIYPRAGFENPFAMVTGVGESEEDSPLRFHLRPKLAHMASRAGFFLRAESMHAFLTAVDRQQKAFGYGDRKMQAQSHGESFLDVLRQRFEDVGVYFLDEPEAALSFQSSLALLVLLDTMRREGSQVIMATHSPILASLPGATILELGDHGIRVVDTAADLGLVQHWRSFLDSPDRYLRHLLTDDSLVGLALPEL
jgi:predicted ATPase